MQNNRTFALINRYFPYVWLAALAAYILAGTPLVPFHGDESTLIYMSHDYAYEFIQHDLSKIYYTPTPSNPSEQELRLINGTVSKYLIGLAWHIGGFTVDDVNEQWDWSADWNYNYQYGHAPTEALLHTTRWSSAILLAAGVFVMFALGNRVGGKPAAYAASLYYALNPALLLNGRRAMMEGSFIFFSLLVVLAGVWLVTKPTLGRGILLGLVAGLALASKHTAVFTIAAVFVTALLYLVYQSLRGKDDASVVEYLILPYLAIAVVVAAATFFLLNPAWWDAPIQRGQEVLEMRQKLLDGQTHDYGSYTNVTDRLRTGLQNALLAQPQYFEVPGWNIYIGDQITRYEASGWSGVSVGGTALGAAILSVMLVAGVWGLIYPKRLPLSRKQEGEEPSPLPIYPPIQEENLGARWIVGIWALVMAGTTLLLTPLNWQRYYMPIYPAIGVIAGVGVSMIIRWITHVWMKRRSSFKPILTE